MTAARRSVSVMHFCRQRYGRSLETQQHYARRHLDALAGTEREHLPAKNILLYGDHEPVYTVGNRNSLYSKEEEDKLTALGCDFYRTNRGGLITFHGPGQLIVYPILNLKDFGIGVRDYVYRLQNAVIKTCQAYGVDARTSEHTGIWVMNRKICAIGVHARRHITTHGIALNCNNNLTWFKNIVPCGLAGKEVTSLTKEVGEFITYEEASQFFFQAFMEEFGCHLVKNQETHPDLQHPTPPKKKKKEVSKS